MTEDKKTQGAEEEMNPLDSLEGLEDLEEVEEDGAAVEEPDMETLQQELNEAREKVLRVAADADNFKKRMEREKERLLKYAGENILRDLLATVDNLDRALEQGGVEGGDPQQKLEALLAGVDLTRKGLDSMLERFDVTPLEAVGQPFDPDEMDALTMEASDEVPANHILKEFAKGFMFKDRVLRHAQVVVSSGSEDKD
jgi:molecular chaperone GrpE